MLVIAMRQRRDYSVGSSGHPAGIGRAPENVLGMKIERKLAGHMMGHDRLMNMHRALGSTGGAAGEMQQREILGLGRRDLEPVVGIRH